MTSEQSPADMPAARRPRPALLGALVGLAAAALYRPMLGAGFINLDDPQYVTQNAYILLPTWGKLAAFFTEVMVPGTVGGYYQPLTMASLMLDRVIEGTLAGGYSPLVDPFIYHLTNVVLHGVNAALIFALVWHVSGRRAGIAFFCGLLFAVHPLNVEAVAWVSQRKALLSTTFALLMLLTYGRYARSGSLRSYSAVMGAFVLSLLAKPTGMLLPLVLLLADVWPLRRWSRRAVIEKLPLLAVATIAGWIAFESQERTTLQVQNVVWHDPREAVLIVCHNVTFYLSRCVLPIRLCPQYPLPPPDRITLTNPAFLGGVMGTAALVAAVGLAAVRRRHAVWTCLVAFVLLLAPALGPVRFGGSIAGDRFAYLPLAALLIMIADLVASPIVSEQARARIRRRRLSLGPAAMPAGIAAAIAFAIVTHHQQSVWRNGGTYYQAVIDRFPDDASGHVGLACWHLEEHDRWLREDQTVAPARGDELLALAEDGFQRALQRDPGYFRAYFRVGEIRMLQGRLQDALEIIQEGMSNHPDDPEGVFYLGLAYSRLGQYEQAIEPYRLCLQYKPAWREALRNLANALLRTGRAAESLDYYARLYEIDPTDVDGLQNWGVALITTGRPEAATGPLGLAVHRRMEAAEAASREDKASALSNLADARFTLAGALAMIGDGDGAMRELRAAAALRPALAAAADAHPAFELLRRSEEWRTWRSEPLGRGP